MNHRLIKTKVFPLRVEQSSRSLGCYIRQFISSRKIYFSIISNAFLDCCTRSVRPHGFPREIRGGIKFRLGRLTYSDCIAAARIAAIRGSSLRERLLWSADSRMETFECDNNSRGGVKGGIIPWARYVYIMRHVVYYSVSRPIVHVRGIHRLSIRDRNISDTRPCRGSSTTCSFLLHFFFLTPHFRLPRLIRVHRLPRCSPMRAFLVNVYGPTTRATINQMVNGLVAHFNALMNSEKMIDATLCFIWSRASTA